VNLLNFGLQFDMSEPNVWDLVPDIHLSEYGVHVKQWPWFAHPNDWTYTGLNWQTVEGGFVYYA